MQYGLDVPDEKKPPPCAAGRFLACTTRTISVPTPPANILLLLSPFFPALLLPPQLGLSSSVLKAADIGAFAIPKPVPRR